MDYQILKSMYANTIGTQVLDYLEHQQPEELALAAESESLKLISEIKAILDDKTTEDRECFRRIEAIVNAFEARGLHTPRHDW